MSKVRKSKELFPKTAIDSDVSEEIVQDVVNFFYSKLIKDLESLQYPRVRVPVLGSFVASKPKLRKRISIINNFLESDEKESFGFIKKSYMTTQLRDRQQDLLNKIILEEDERNKFKEDLQKQKANNRRD